MKYRVFGSNNCHMCKLLTSELKAAGLNFSFVDANADETQDLCDLFDVDELPHVQVLSGDGKLLAEHIGFITVDKLKKVTSHFVEAEDEHQTE